MRPGLGSYQSQDIPAHELVCGPVDPRRMVQVRDMAEKYFGRWRQEAIPALPPSPSEVLAQPPAGAERRLDSSARGGPALMQAFYRPGIASADAPILDVIGCDPPLLQCYISVPGEV